MKQHEHLGAKSKRIFLRETDPHITELAGVLTGIKPVIYTHFDSKNLPYIRSLCRTFGLHCWIPPRTRFISKNSHFGRGTLFIGKTQELIQSAVWSWKKDTMDLEWARLLGYPDCCARFYLNKRRASEKSGRNQEIVRWILANTRGKRRYSFLLNNIFNFFSRTTFKDEQGDHSRLEAVSALNRPLSLSALHVIPWHPCSYTCKESLRRGRIIYRYLRAHVPSCAEFLERYLRVPVLFSDKYEFAVFREIKRGPSGFRCKDIRQPFSLMAPRLASMPEKASLEFPTGTVFLNFTGGLS